MVHPSAIISTESVIEKDVVIGPFCIIESGVTIKKGSVLESHIILKSGVTIGENCYISTGCSFSSDATRLDFRENKSTNSDHHVFVGNHVHFEPYSTVHGSVFIGNNVWFGSNVVIHHGARVGNYCKIFSGAIVGSIPQDLKFEGEESTLCIGDNTVVREFATLNRGTKHSNTTIIGKNCLIMAYVHVAHDCRIGDNVILANSVNMGGHVQIDDFVVVGGMAAIHQFVRIGKHAMVSGGSLIGKDIPPFVNAGRYPVQYEGINRVGLKRRNFSSDQLNRMHDIYRILFCMGYAHGHALEEIEKSIPESVEKNEIMLFLKSGENRGIIKGIKI
ncbi:MAG: acyl-ACP--UDP-N-acetylglucosamine O-acyltransferase [Bacteroidia bacterium]|nr:acyl-ACP--UDP-N-acetylglucosamine O-acyltransferase [Bacteroidia bacterium]